MGIHESDSNLTWSPSDTEYSPLTLERGGKIIHTSDVYQVVGLLGTGSFGKVFKCRKEGTDETVAMKVFRKGNHWQAKREVNSHNQVSVLDLDKNNLIRLIDSFVYKDCFCLTFECLYLNLTELIIRRYEGLEVNDIRSIAQQVLLALRALKIIGMTHTDIKPNNIMLTAPQGPQSLNVKLINFGSARKTAELSEYSVMQNERYRAPEVILGLPRDESIDMWGLGCTLAYLYQASHLFPKDEYITMHFIVKHLGLPDKEMLDKGWRARRFLKLDKRRTKPFWRLRIFEEYKHPVCCHAAPEYPCDDFLTLPPNLGNRNDSLSFIDLVKKMLAANPADRILPEEALNHPFITMNYLPGSSLSSNVSEIHKIPTGSLITDQDRVTEVKIHESGLNLTKSTDEMESSNLILKTGVKIFHQSDAYQVEELLGTGSFGNIFKCRKEGTDETVAMKVFRKGNHWQAKREVNSHNQLRILHADANSLIRFIDSFVYKDCFCLTFECLNTTFVELFKETRFKLQRVIYLRTVGQQMLLALQALKSVGVTHTDIKPDNVMIAHLDNQSVRVKLSDFGLARKTAELSEYSVMQTEGYRAPEVILGLPRDESIDMWGLGCMLGFLYLGNHLFPDDDFKALQCIVKHMGLPDKNALKEGWRVRRFFKFDRLHKWRLKDPKEYQHKYGKKNFKRHSFNLFDEPLDDLVRLKPAWSNAKGKKLFIDLLIKMLAVNPADRILPEDALSHPFITMEHFPVPDYLIKWKEAHEIAESEFTDQNRVTEVEIHESDVDLTSSTDEIESSSLLLDEGVKIINQSDVYRTESLIGSGSFGTVVKCAKEGTDEMVAIKVFSKKKLCYAKEEVIVHNQLSVLDPDKHNLIRFIDSFAFEESFCLVFELLYLSLADLLEQPDYERLSFSYIRPIANQMLVALQALKSIGITHTDVKPDNIMLVHQNPQSVRVKLIDFGMARKTAELSDDSLMQADGYRAPEVILGLPRDEGIDMWGLGCTLAFLYAGQQLFSENDYDAMRCIARCIGLPDTNMLENGKYVDRIFKVDKSSPDHIGRFKYESQEEEETEFYPKDQFDYNVYNSLYDLMLFIPPGATYIERQDVKSFIDLLQEMLAVNPANRILPEDALNHTFITMGHFHISSFSSSVSETDEISAGSPTTDHDSVTKVEIHKSDTDLTESRSDTESSPLTLEKGVKLIHQSDVSQIDEACGSGGCTQEVKCRKEGTDETVAVKVLQEMPAVNPADTTLPGDALITIEHFHTGSFSSSVSETDEISAGSPTTDDDSVTEVEILKSDSDLSESCSNTESPPLTLEKGDKLINSSDVYQIEEVFRSGGCTQVVKCRKEGTDEIVAVKVFTKQKNWQAMKEVNAYDDLSDQNSDKNKEIRLMDTFIYKDCLCLVYEFSPQSFCEPLEAQTSTCLSVAVKVFTCVSLMGLLVYSTFLYGYCN
ncbi:putative LOC107389052-like protein [Nothobranchius furzeri]|uniref:LOC107389052-like protein n=1 Tax=Nothobranchius furzeri TaxID=105023 RepID=A0A9D2YPT4_NOTFU|nr:putative LOC107389052-like protein [Nothobranchius furzeri]